MARMWNTKVLRRSDVKAIARSRLKTSQFYAHKVDSDARISGKTKLPAHCIPPIQMHVAC